jgi:nucleotide-binding universal stress UspA family protein
VQFRKVIVGIDGTAHGRGALALALALAEPGARLTLAHVHPGAIPGTSAEAALYAADPTYTTAARECSQRLLELERDTAAIDAELVTLAHPTVGPALRGLARDQAADLLVVGASRHGLAGRILYGDDAHATITGACCPVAIAPRDFNSTACRSTLEAPIATATRVVLTGQPDLLLIQPTSRDARARPRVLASTPTAIARRVRRPILVMPREPVRRRRRYGIHFGHGAAATGCGT